MSMTQEAKEEVTRLIRQGNKLQAIKYLHDTFNISLADGKMLVDALANELDPLPSPTESVPYSSLQGEDRMAVERFIREGKKIEAVKFVNKKFNLGLKEALVQVEVIQKEIDPDFVPSTSGCTQNIFRIVAFFFTFIGMILLGAGLLIYYLDSAIVKDENKTEGIVIALTGSGTVAPTIAYTWKGQSYTFQSTLYSNPPSFSINEKVMVYVNPEKPEEIVIDSFSERWLAIVILAAIGGVFAFLGIILFFTSRKF